MLSALTQLQLRFRASLIEILQTSLKIVEHSFGGFCRKEECLAANAFIAIMVLLSIVLAIMLHKIAGLAQIVIETEAIVSHVYRWV